MGNTIKIIDLLNKIANGEEVPKQIKINNITFYYTNTPFIDYLYKNENEKGWSDYGCVQLNAEVEIIEDEDEDKNGINIYNIKELKVEQVMGENLEETEFDQYYINGFYIGRQGDELVYAIENIANKVNELIRVANQLNRNKEV